MTWLLILQVTDLTKINTYVPETMYQTVDSNIIHTIFMLKTIYMSIKRTIDRGIKWMLHNSSSNNNKTQTIVTHSNTVTFQKCNEEWKAKHQRYIRHDSMDIMFLKTAQTKLVGHHWSKREENYWDAGYLSLLSSDNTYPQLCASSSTVPFWCIHFSGWSLNLDKTSTNLERE